MDFEIREDRTGRGRRLTREREAYFQLMQQGCSSAEACRIVGVNLRTGKRWRNGWHSPPNGRKPVPPIRVEVPAPGPSRYLREEDRIHIADRLREYASIRAIASEPGRRPSTISREIRRNGMPLRGDASRWAYRPHAAHRRAEQRRPRPKPGKIGQNPELRDFIQNHLDRKWSPEQICQALRDTISAEPAAAPTTDAAVDLAGRGLAVFALPPGARRPATGGWSTRCWTDPDEVRRRRREGDNIGVACRASSASWPATSTVPRAWWSPCSSSRRRCPGPALTNATVPASCAATATTGDAEYDSGSGPPLPAGRGGPGTGYGASAGSRSAASSEAVGGGGAHRVRHRQVGPGGRRSGGESRASAVSVARAARCSAGAGLADAEEGEFGEQVVDPGVGAGGDPVAPGPRSADGLCGRERP